MGMSLYISQLKSNIQEFFRSVYKVLRGSQVVSYVCITLVVCKTVEEMFCSWVIQTGI